MSITIRNLTVLNYGNGFTLWHYKTNSPLLDCEILGLFNPAKNALADRDMLLVSAPDGGGQFYITHKDGDVLLHRMCRT